MRNELFQCVKLLSTIPSSVSEMKKLQRIMLLPDKSAIIHRQTEGKKTPRIVWKHATFVSHQNKLLHDTFNIAKRLFLYNTPLFVSKI
jgi:hypothetical protein